MIRLAEEHDLESAFDVWLESNVARRGGRAVHPNAPARVRAHLERPSSFPLVRLLDEQVIAMSCGMQAIDIDGDGHDIPGLCHIALVFVRPACWGKGHGRAIVEATLSEAGRRGFSRAQLWTHSDNHRAQRLYERLGFVATGRVKPDEDEGEEIRHYERAI